uniref:Small ribosomal subunit protein uS11c n=1 Tax=Selaginella lyallii TaxID=137159 RepID=A0A481ZM14_9TRAC|nr:ribosomal protein S11 [Selaginella lyallii]QBL02096.1 ribosomal protein S11 [Selaginella lyallii]
MMKKISTTRVGKRKGGVSRGVVHIRASFNNTIVTIADARGRVLSWVSAGACGFKGAKKGTAFAAQTVAESAIRTLVDQGVERAEVAITGPGPGRDTALRAFCGGGIALGLVRDVTPVPHNGCRPPGRRHI